MRHELEDWAPVDTDSGLVMQYRCGRCGVLIQALVILCAEQDAAALQEQMPGRLVWGYKGLPDGWRELGDGRKYARATGAPSCSVPQRELEPS